MLFQPSFSGFSETRLIRNIIGGNEGLAPRNLEVPGRPWEGIQLERLQATMEAAGAMDKRVNGTYQRLNSTRFAGIFGPIEQQYKKEFFDRFRTRSDGTGYGFSLPEVNRNILRRIQNPQNEQDQ